MSVKLGCHPNALHVSIGVITMAFICSLNYIYWIRYSGDNGIDYYQYKQK